MVGFLINGCDVLRPGGLALILHPSYDVENQPRWYGYLVCGGGDTVDGLTNVLKQKADTGTLRCEAVVAVLLDEGADGALGHAIVLSPELDEQVVASH